MCVALPPFVFSSESSRRATTVGVEMQSELRITRHDRNGIQACIYIRMFSGVYGQVIMTAVYCWGSKVLLSMCLISHNSPRNSDVVHKLNLTQGLRHYLRIRNSKLNTIWCMVLKRKLIIWSGTGYTPAGIALTDNVQRERNCGPSSTSGSQAHTH